MHSDIQVLFLHNITESNASVVNQNYSSFQRCGNSIIGIKDEDALGLTNAIPVPINNHLPRGANRWASPDVVYMNYILNHQQNLTHKYYMLCEYDCYCEGNLDVLFEKYKKYDVVAPRITYFNHNPDWQWFEPLKNKIPKEFLIGFMPATFILFNKESIIRVAEKYKEHWQDLEKSNVEARLGVISKMLNLNIASCEEFACNINWFPIHFRKNYSIYHPVKDIIDSSFFVKKPENSTKNSGRWEFGRFKEEKLQKICDLYLQRDGVISEAFHDNETYWGEDKNHLYFYNSRGNITTIFNINPYNFYTGHYYDGEYIPKINNKNYHWLRRV